MERAGESAQGIVRAADEVIELRLTGTNDVVIIQQCREREQAKVSGSWWSALVDSGWVERGSELTAWRKPDRRSAPMAGPL